MEGHLLFGKRRETESIRSPPRRTVLCQQNGHRHRASFSSNVGRDIARGHKNQRALQVAILIAAGASSLVINGYYNALKAHQQDACGYSLSSPSSSVLHLIEACLSSLKAQQHGRQDSQLPVFIRNPSPEQLVAACLVYGTAMNSYYYLHKGDRYQHWFAASGAVNAFAVGWASGKDINGIFIDFMPWFLILSLMLSAALHNVHAKNQSQQAVEITG